MMSEYEKQNNSAFEVEDSDCSDCPKSAQKEADSSSEHDLEEWHEIDWDWDAGTAADSSVTESSEIAKPTVSMEVDDTREFDSYVLEGEAFSVEISEDIAGIDYEVISSFGDNTLKVEATQGEGKSKVAELHLTYQSATFPLEILGDLYSLLASYGMPECYWSIYWSSAYRVPLAELLITKWMPSWDAEIECENGNCFLLKRKSDIGSEVFMWPYNLEHADCLHLFIPERSSFDDEQVNSIAMGIAKNIKLKNPVANTMQGFLVEAMKKRVDAADLIGIAETLTSVFIALQSVVIDACVSRVVALGVNQHDERELDCCFEGVRDLHSRATKYLSLLLDVYEAQITFGATVAERSEILSYIGAFDGNILPNEIAIGQERVTQIPALRPSNELIGVRSRLEHCRSMLRNNPNNIPAANAEDIEEERSIAERFSIGDEFYLGRYYWENEDVLQPLEWRVIDIVGTHALCVSKHLIDCLHFNEFEGDVTWETSTVREWLNGEFADIAFSPDDRRLIAGARLTNEPNPEFGTPAGNSTKDRVFLLSASEYDRFLYPVDDKPEPSPYAEEAGANQWWWLRSPGHKESHVAYVSAEGVINNTGTKASLLARAIRPAIYLKLSSCDNLLINEAGGQEND